jgi:hypothetical protein
VIPGSSLIFIVVAPAQERPDDDAIWKAFPLTPYEML